MAEQILIDYIRKARSAGQADEQTRALLYKNGWTELEVSDAVEVLNPQPQETTPVQQPTQQQTRPQPQMQPEINQEPKIQNQQQPVEQLKPEPEVEKVETKITIQPQQPQTAQQVKSMPQPQYNMPQMRSRSHGLLKFIIILLILGILGVSGWYFGAPYIKSLKGLSLKSLNELNPLKPAGPVPETIVTKMITGMKAVKSYHTAIQLDASEKSSQTKLSLVISGDNDSTDVSNPKSSYSIKANLTTKGSATPSASAILSFITIDKASYFKIDNVVSPETYSSYLGLNVSKIKGKWFKIDQDSINALSQAQVGQSGTANVAQTTASDLVSKFQNLISTENMISAEKQLADEAVDGQSDYHYSSTINKIALKDFITKAAALFQGATADAATKNMLSGLANSISGSIGDTNMDMWIGKIDHLLYKSGISSSIDLSKINPGVKSQIQLSISTTNSNFNKSIIVQAPEGTQKIEEIILPMLKVQKVMTDIEKIGETAQSSFTANKTYVSLCNKGLLNGYLPTFGSVLVTLHTDIVTQGAKKPVCFSSVTNYCLSAQLSDGSYICTDNTGATGTTKCVTAKTVCK